MSIIMKAALFCDGCGKRVDLDPSRAPRMKFSPMALRGTGLEGWREVRPGKHLCPECMVDWGEMKREQEREEDARLGIERIEFEL